MSVLCHYLNYWYLCFCCRLCELMLTKDFDSIMEYEGFLLYLCLMIHVLVPKNPTMKRWRIHKNRFPQNIRNIIPFQSCVFFPLKNRLFCGKQSLLKISSQQSVGFGGEILQPLTSGVAGVPLHWTLILAQISSSSSTDFSAKHGSGLGKGNGTPYFWEI